MCTQYAGGIYIFFQSCDSAGQLGRLQDTIIQLAGVQRCVQPSIRQRTVAVFCADNGVVAQGVTQCGQEVTAIVTENLNRAQTSVCRMAARIGVQVLPVDIGVARDIAGEQIMHRKIAYGTADMTKGAAMSRRTVFARLKWALRWQNTAKDVETSSRQWVKWASAIPPPHQRSQPF